MHTQLFVEGSRIMFSDVFPDMPFSQGNNIILAVLSENEPLLRRYFEKLKEDGTVNMEMQKTFWSRRYRSVVDKFGIEWQLNFDVDS